MHKQALIIGLGQFGMSLARALTERQVEVLAVDREESRVREAASFAAEAVCFDATDEASLAKVAPERRDVCVCAVGDEARDSSIICTALLRQLGARLILARAGDSLHERILYLVGAHEVVNPESAFGMRLATRLAYEGVLGEFSLGKGLYITEIRVPKTFAGRSLADLHLRRRYRISVVAIRQANGVVVIPEPGDPLGTEDILVVLSDREAIARLQGM